MKPFKRQALVLIIVLVGLFVVIPSFGKAATIEELRAKIAELMVQLTVLQQAQRGGQTWCHTFNTNLKIGDMSEEVRALDIALRREGVGNPILLNGQPSLISDDGVFIEPTASAVSEFQEKYRAEVLTPVGLKYGTGYVGPSTRAKLNQLYGCGMPIPPIPPQPYITVISPNGGERLYQGQTYDVLWSAPRGYFVGIFASPMAGGADVLVAPTYAQMNSPYHWTVPATVVPGDYRIKIQLAEIGNNNEILRFVAEDSSDSPFSIVMAVQGGTPSISSLSSYSGPIGTAIAINGSGFIGHDTLVWLDNGSQKGLLWSGMPSDTLITAVLQASLCQTYTGGSGLPCSSYFTVVPGTYRIYVQNQNGTSNSVSFIVTSSPTQPPITVLSPNGGETWTKGTTQTIQWRQDATPVPCLLVGAYCPPSPPIYYDIELVSYYPSPCQPGSECPVPLPYTIANNVSGFSYSWSVGKIMTSGGIAPDGSYMVQICQSGTNICDASDSYFKVVSGIPEPYIQVLSPNGGEMWQTGMPQTIRWNSQNAPTVMVDLVRSGYEYHPSGGDVPNTGFFTFVVPNYLPIASDYKIRVMHRVNAVPVAEDSSDAPFSIMY